MTTTGVLHLGPGDLRAEPYHRWRAWIGHGYCDLCCAEDEGVHWRYVTSTWTLTACESCADGFNRHGKMRAPRSEWDDPREHGWLKPWECSYG